MKVCLIVMVYVPVKCWHFCCCGPYTKLPILVSAVDKMCTLWNKGHVRTFDNEVYSFVSDCDIPVSSNCKNEYTDFDISAKRDGRGFMKYIRFRLEATLIVIEGTQIKLDGDM